MSQRPRPPLPPGPYLVVGLARSGAGAVRMLKPHGEVVGVDASDEPDHAAGLRDEGFEVHVGTDGVELLERAATVVKSPGVRPFTPVVAEARARGMTVTGELELAWRLLANEFVAVTGTNGKTTTVELLGEMHRAAGVPVAVAGNVGTAVSELVGGVDAGAVVVCETSSFQLADSDAFAPEAAVMLNLGVDHLDWHGSVDAYVQAKLRVFANQERDDVSVAPAALLAGRDLPGGARRVSFGGTGADMEEREAALWWRGERFIDATEIRLRGAHNRENAMAASAVALERGLPADAVREALRRFAGVPHRLEEVATRRGVVFVNDSKATNVDSAAVGIAAFERGVHVILGGRVEGDAEFRALREVVAARCRAGYLVGEAAADIEDALAGTVPMHPCGTLDRAVSEAAAAARPGDVVVLSPACKSYDQYRNFEERGDHFRKLVMELGE